MGWTNHISRQLCPVKLSQRVPLVSVQFFDSSWSWRNKTGSSSSTYSWRSSSCPCGRSWWLGLVFHGGCSTTCICLWRSRVSRCEDICRFCTSGCAWRWTWLGRHDALEHAPQVSRIWVLKWIPLAFGYRYLTFVINNCSQFIRLEKRGVWNTSLILYGPYIPWSWKQHLAGHDAHPTDHVKAALQLLLSADFSPESLFPGATLILFFFF